MNRDKKIEFHDLKYLIKELELKNILKIYYN